MNESFSSFQSTPRKAPAQAYGAAIYTHPSDVTSDPTLSTAEKRAVLASWISDARAVENAPSLRRLDSGAVVEVDAILQALVLLDESAPGRGGELQTGAALGPQAQRDDEVAEAGRPPERRQRR